MTHIQVAPVPAPDIPEPLRLLEEWLRDGEPVPKDFVGKIQDFIRAGDVEVLAARLGGRMVGVLVLSFRPNVSLGGLFASIEDLYVRPESRCQGVGAALLKAVDERCTEREIYYVEAQVEGSGAGAFYTASGFEQEPDVRVFSRSIAFDDRRDEKLKADG